ncbi:hypothetical protein [Formosa maritima]|uniref:Uncharacterized protein n=1 Tax=Formosa maritima TaxID=2592046 RepID=A0A5D0G1F0_9FLAO|nr:hypothetical protein [Formosa maritima]TYA52380.1 hypothetical protein FVF61_13655 [Formosa maritima]
MKLTITVLIMFYSIIAFGQDKQQIEIFETDSTWIKEIIEFPIGFAQNINYEGFEDLRFPEGWSKEESHTFWSYVWAWKIKDIGEVTENELETNIQYYFDGLLGLDLYKIDDKHVRKTNTVFIKKDNSHYIGKVKTFDTRYTKKPLTLNVLVETHYCSQEKKRIIYFKFSPKPFEDDVWNTLDEVTLRIDVCENQINSQKQQ